MREIVLIPGGAEHDDGRSHGQWWHGKRRADHPVGPGELGIHAENVALLVGNVSELNGKHHQLLTKHQKLGFNDQF